MASDNVLLLTYTQPLPLPNYTTPAVIISDYYSLSIVTKSDSGFELTLQFSGDGKNWDVSSPTYSVVANVGQNINYPVTAKWTRIVLTDVDGIGTYFRMYVYGKPDCCSDPTPEPNPPPSSVVLASRSATGEANVNEWVTETSFVASTVVPFSLGGVGTWIWANQLNQQVNSPYLPNLDIIPYATTTAPGGGLVRASNGSCTGSPAPYIGFVQFRGQGINGDFSNWGFLSRYVSPNSGAPVEMLFNGKWELAFPGLSHMTPNMVGFWDIDGISLGGWQNPVSTPIPRNGFGFGFWPGAPTMTSLTEFQIIWFHDHILQPVILQSSWNVDKMDGTGNLPAFSPNDGFLDFKIAYCPTTSVVRFYVMDKASGIYYLVHYISFSANQYYVGAITTFASGIFSVPLNGAPMPDDSVWRFLTSGWSTRIPASQKYPISRGLSSKDSVTLFYNDAMPAAALSGGPPFNTTLGHVVTVYNPEEFSYFGAPAYRKREPYYLAELTLSTGANTYPSVYSLWRNDVNLRDNVGAPLAFVPLSSSYSNVNTPLLMNRSVTNTIMGTSGHRIANFFVSPSTSNYSYNFKAHDITYLGANQTLHLYISAFTGSVGGPNITMVFRRY